MGRVGGRHAMWPRLLALVVPLIVHIACGSSFEAACGALQYSPRKETFHHRGRCFVATELDAAIFWWAGERARRYMGQGERGRQVHGHGRRAGGTRHVDAALRVRLAASDAVRGRVAVGRRAQDSGRRRHAERAHRLRVRTGARHVERGSVQFARHDSPKTRARAGGRRLGGRRAA